MAKILSFGIDQDFLERRAQLLARLGIKASSAAQKDEAIRLARQMHPDIAIFGHKVPAALRANLTRSFKKINPTLQVICIYDGSIEGTEEADAVLNLRTEAQVLAETIKYLADRVNTASAGQAS